MEEIIIWAFGMYFEVPLKRQRQIALANVCFRSNSLGLTKVSLDIYFIFLKKNVFQNH